MVRNKINERNTNSGSNNVKTVVHKMVNCNHFLKRTPTRGRKTLIAIAKNI